MRNLSSPKTRGARGWKRPGSLAPVFLALLLMAVAPAACTFLVEFSDAADGGSLQDEAGEEDSSTRTEDVASERREPEANPNFCPAYTADPNAAPCDINAGRAVTAYCACDRLRNYQGSPNDLVQCSTDGAVVDASPCANGCALLQANMSDICDPCDGKDDGKYCVTEFGVDAGRVVFGCRAGHQDLKATVECVPGTRCTGAGPDAGCGT